MLKRGIFSGMLSLGLVLGSTLAMSQAYADGFAPLTILVKRQSTLIAQIEPYVERADLPKLKFLEQSNTGLMNAILSEGLANMDTVQQLQQVVVAYRFSKDIFDQIRTQRTTAQIDELQTTAQQIASMSGFDQSPYTKITYGVFHQLRDMTLELLDLSIPASLAAQLRAIQPQIGRVMAAASQGDHRLTIDEGGKCLQQVMAMYPAFNQISVSDVAFDAVVEIQGIAEFYSAFIKSDDPLDPSASAAKPAGK